MVRIRVPFNIDFFDKMLSSPKAAVVKVYYLKIIILLIIIFIKRFSGLQLLTMIIHSDKVGMQEIKTYHYCKGVIKWID